MIKNFLLISILTISTALAGLPPTTSKIDGDATKKTTFDYEFPNFTGTHTGTKVNITGASTLPVSGDIILNGANYNGIAAGKAISHQMSTGVVDGALLTINTNPALFDISQQILSFSDGSASLDTPVVRFVTCPALTAQTVTNLASTDTTYISVTPACAIVQSTTFPTQVQRRTNAFVGRLAHLNHTSINAASVLPDLVVDTNSQLYDLFDAMGAFNVTGNVLSPNGANLSFNKSAGSVFRRSANFATSKQNPHVLTIAGTTPQSFIKITQNAVNATPVSVIDPGNYDVAGTVTAVPGGGATSTNRRIYLFSSGLIAVQYGQVSYSSLANAIAGISTEAFVINPQAADGGILLAVVSCRKDATDLSNIAQCQINRVGRFDQTGVTTGSLATTTLQQAYNNSVTPQVTTDSTKGALDFKRGSAADTDNVIRVLNGAGTSTMSVSGNGLLTLGTPLALTSGGTGQTTKAAAFDALSPMTTGGDIIYGGASGTGTRLPNGSSGQFLKSNGGTSAPSWATATNTAVILAKTGSYTLTTSDQVVYWDVSGGVGTATLPTAVGNGGLTLTISVQVGGTNALTVNTTSSQTIGGVASGAITMKNAGARLQVISDGANWLVTAKTSGVPSIPGFNGSTDIISVRYGTTNVTTACSGTPCFISQQGTAVTSVTRSGTGMYSLNLARNYTDLICNMTSVGAVNYTSTQINAFTSGTSTQLFQTGTGPTSENTSGSIVCIGTY